MPRISRRRLQEWLRTNLEDTASSFSPTTGNSVFDTASSLSSTTGNSVFDTSPPTAATTTTASASASVATFSGPAPPDSERVTDASRLAARALTSVRPPGFRTGFSSGGRYTSSLTFASDALRSTHMAPAGVLRWMSKVSSSCGNITGTHVHPSTETYGTALYEPAESENEAIVSG